MTSRGTLDEKLRCELVPWALSGSRQAVLAGGVRELGQAICSGLREWPGRSALSGQGAGPAGGPRPERGSLRRGGPVGRGPGDPRAGADTGLKTQGQCRTRSGGRRSDDRPRSFSYSLPHPADPDRTARCPCWAEARGRGVRRTGTCSHGCQSGTGTRVFLNPVKPRQEEGGGSWQEGS